MLPLRIDRSTNPAYQDGGACVHMANVITDKFTVKRGLGVSRPDFSASDSEIVNGTGLALSRRGTQYVLYCTKGGSWYLVEAD